MICPYCGNEMEKGYIDQTDFMHPLEWYPAKEEPALSSIFGKRRIVRLTYAGNSAIAHRCESCKKIILDENTLNA